MRNKWGGLWLNRDFLRLWTGETISLFGSQITALALPLTAVFVFQVTPMQMGLLNAAQFVPYMLVTLFAGVWIDRSRRRPIMIGANMCRALLLGAIPIAAMLGGLRMEHLYAVTFLCGVLSVLFELAYTAYLPSLVDRSHLVEGNSKLHGSAAVTDVAGPGLAGALVSLVSAPIAILVDAVSYLISALFLSQIRRPEPKPDQSVGERGSIIREMSMGLRLVLANPYLRAIAGEAGTYNMCNQITWAVLMLYLTRELHFGPTLLGLVMGAASAGSLLGALGAKWLGQRLGTGRAIILTMGMACGAPLLITLAAGPIYVTVPMLILAFALGGAGVTISVIHVASLRQSITPPHLMGRVAAGYRFISLGVTPLGALIGGVLGTNIGLRPTLLVGAVGTVSALLWVWFSPVAKLESLPTEVPTEEGTPAPATVTP